MKNFDIFKTCKYYKDRIEIGQLVKQISSDDEVFRDFLAEELDSRTLSVLYQRLSELTYVNFSPKISKIADHNNVNPKDEDKYYYVIKNNVPQPVYEVRDGIEKLITETTKTLDDKIKNFKTYKHDSGQAYGNYKVKMEILCYEAIYSMPFIKLYTGNLTNEEHILKFNTDKSYKEYIVYSILSVLNGSYYQLKEALNFAYISKDNEERSNLTKVLVQKAFYFLNSSYMDNIIYCENNLNESLNKPLIKKSNFTRHLEKISKFKHLIDINKFGGDDFLELTEFIHEQVFQKPYTDKNNDKKCFNFFLYLSNTL